MAIAKEFKEERLVALERQRLLHKNHCKKCPHYYDKKLSRQVYNELCDKCPVKFELLEIGTVLNTTLGPRKA